MEVKLERNEFGEWGYREFLLGSYGEWIPIYLNNWQPAPTDSDPGDVIPWIKEKLRAKLVNY
jgi:hypothetical protein